MNKNDRGVWREKQGNLGNANDKSRQWRKTETEHSEVGKTSDMKVYGFQEGSTTTMIWSLEWSMR